MEAENTEKMNLHREEGEDRGDEERLMPTRYAGGQLPVSHLKLEGEDILDALL